MGRFCYVNLGIFLFQHFLDLIEFFTITILDEVKCSLAIIVLGFYVYAKFFPIFQYHLNRFCLANHASIMQSCPSTSTFSVQVNVVDDRLIVLPINRPIPIIGFSQSIGRYFQTKTWIFKKKNWRNSEKIK